MYLVQQLTANLSNIPGNFADVRALPPAEAAWRVHVSGATQPAAALETGTLATGSKQPRHCRGGLICTEAPQKSPKAFLMAKPLVIKSRHLSRITIPVTKNNLEMNPKFFLLVLKQLI